MSFEKRVSGKAVVYGVPSDLSVGLAQAISEDVLKDAAGGARYEAVVLDIGKFDLDPKTFKVLSPMGLELLKEQTKVYVLTTRNSNHSLIKQEGMERLAKPIRSLGEIAFREVMSEKKAPTRIDVNFLNPFIDGTLQVLKVQCQTEASPMKPSLKSASPLPCPVDIAGIIGLTSQSFQGSIALCFPEKVFLRLMSRMLGEEFTELNDELKDGAAEMANMILGHAKKVLNEKGHTIEKALPSVIRGPSLKIDHAGSHDAIILPFSVEELIFFMEIATEQN